MELLRIIAMFLVLVAHADYFSIGVPMAEDIASKPLPSFTRILMESISIVCVNVFVLLSGWFGIKPKFKSISNFCFQCLFFLISIYVICLAFGRAQLNLKGIAECFCLTKWNWFIKAYILLYIISPILNAFIENADKRTYKMILVFFFLFQSFYGWLTQAVDFYLSGYTPFSFMGLYLLARYLHLYPCKFSNLSRNWYLFGYWVITLLMASFCFADSMGEPSGFTVGMFTYYNPLVILSSLCLLLYFSKLSIQNTFINWMAASSFAVFLLHSNPNIALQYFQPLMQNIYAQYDGVAYLAVITCCLLLIFTFAVLIDQIRIAGFKWTYPYMEKIYKNSLS
ncbi:MAG: acyltransferase family protein [Prevotella sp.]